jgi:hypothetical protein
MIGFSLLLLRPYLKHGLPEYFKKERLEHGFMISNDIAILIGAPAFFIFGLILLIKGLYDIVLEFNLL